jgi:hypothetical protein
MSSQTNTNPGIRFFAPEVIFGSKKLVDINTGDFFPFATEEEDEQHKRAINRNL